MYIREHNSRFASVSLSFLNREAGYLLLVLYLNMTLKGREIL